MYMYTLSTGTFDIFIQDIKRESDFIDERVDDIIEEEEEEEEEERAEKIEKEARHSGRRGRSRTGTRRESERSSDPKDLGKHMGVITGENMRLDTV